MASTIRPRSATPSHSETPSYSPGIPRDSAPGIRCMRPSTDMNPHEQARQRRGHAAAAYRPRDVRLLLIAEAPPSDLDRYFYFEQVRDQDSLFRYVVQTVLREAPSRASSLMTVSVSGMIAAAAAPCTARAA